MIFLPYDYPLPEEFPVRFVERIQRLLPSIFFQFYSISIQETLSEKINNGY